jgi:hypothetical protein
MCQSRSLTPVERVVMSLDKMLEDYWICQYCGKDTSEEPKNELVEPDHWDCIINNIIDRKNEQQS